MGELVQRALPAEAEPGAQSLRRRLLLAACCAASNCADLDLVLGRLLPAPLGYLLHHRGYTHTLLFALGQALLLAALVWLLWPGARRLLRASSAARGALLAVCGIGFIMHIAMDYLNSYGVHPFAPFDGRWLYGDTLFIVEPVLWVGFGVPLALMLRSRYLKIALLGLLAGAVALATARGYLHWASLLGLGLVGAALASLRERALGAAVLVACAFIGIQGLASGVGKRLVAAQLQHLDPGSRVLDTSMTAFPANPLCWEFVSVERNDGAGSYRLRGGLVSLAPKLLPVDACPAALGEPLATHTAAIGISWESEGSLAGLRRLAVDCNFHAWLRFARTPAVTAADATDARFSIDGHPNFSTFQFAQFVNQPCSNRIPAWDLPRQDLLAP